MAKGDSLFSYREQLSAINYLSSDAAQRLGLSDAEFTGLLMGKSEPDTETLAAISSEYAFWTETNPQRMIDDALGELGDFGSVSEALKIDYLAGGPIFASDLQYLLDTRQLPFVQLAIDQGLPIAGDLVAYNAAGTRFDVDFFISDYDGYSDFVSAYWEAFRLAYTDS